MKSIIEEIVSVINDSIKSELAAAKYSGKVFYGITERRQHKETIAPCIVSQDGRIEPIYLSNKVPVLFYHKINVTSFEYNIPQSFGKGMITRTTHNMSLVAYCLKTKTGLNGFMLEQIIDKKMPSTWTADFKRKLALKSINTKVQSCDHDAAAIYKRDWSGLKDPLIVPESSLIEVRYQIVRTYKGDCEVNCCN